MQGPSGASGCSQRSSHLCCSTPQGRRTRSCPTCGTGTRRGRACRWRCRAGGPAARGRAGASSCSGCLICRQRGPGTHWQPLARWHPVHSSWGCRGAQWVGARVTHRQFTSVCAHTCERAGQQSTAQVGNQCTRTNYRRASVTVLQNAMSAAARHARCRSAVPAAPSPSRSSAAKRGARMAPGCWSGQGNGAVACTARQQRALAASDEPTNLWTHGSLTQQACPHVPARGRGRPVNTEQRTFRLLGQLAGLHSETGLLLPLQPTAPPPRAAAASSAPSPVQLRRRGGPRSLSWILVLRLNGSWTVNGSLGWVLIGGCVTHHVDGGREGNIRNPAGSSVLY